jgi:uncharacterized membrane protein
MKMLSTVKAAVIAGLYAALVTFLAPISFYVFQFRVADSLLLLPFLDFFGFPGVIGLTVGCAIANVYSPFGIVDVLFGSLANFAAGLVALLIGRRSKSMVSLVATAIVESLIVSAIIGYFVLHLFGGLDILIAFTGVLLGSVFSIGILGVALVVFLMKGLKVS